MTDTAVVTTGPVSANGAGTETSPLTEGLERQPVRSTVLVIFGAVGDLAKRKLLPAIYNLAHDGALPEQVSLIGISRGESTDDEFREVMRDAIMRFSRRTPDPDVLDGLLDRSRYVSGNFDDPELYTKVEGALTEVDRDAGISMNRVFYLSTAPSFFPIIAEQLGQHGMNSEDGADVRIVIEKPIGYDLQSARALNAKVLSYFDESQVFRIDHYLGKETVQNLMALRFANALFEPVWNRNFIDNVQITAAEDIGVGTRAGYYDGAGALRDLVQNHMLQLLALLTMEPPASFEANRLRDEKVKVLESVVLPTPETAGEMSVRGQYGPGVVGGSAAIGYLEEKGVAEGSRTETYAALRLQVDNWRWAGVPFYLRTGKRLAKKLTEIAVTLRPVPHSAFQGAGSGPPAPNQIVLTVQPDEGVSVSLGAKVPGTKMEIRPVNMEFHYGTSFLSESPEAYERLILDAMRGDATLFTRNDEVDALWQIVDPVLTGWAQDTESPIPQYPAGSAGPSEADLLLDGRRWRRL